MQLTIVLSISSCAWVALPVAFGRLHEALMSVARKHGAGMRRMMRSGMDASAEHKSFVVTLLPHSRECGCSSVPSLFCDSVL